MYHDETCKQLTPMEQGEEVEDRRGGGGGGWQSPRRVFLCPSSLGELRYISLIKKKQKKKFLQQLQGFVFGSRTEIVLPSGMPQETVEARRLPEDGCALTPRTSSGKKK